LNFVPANSFIMRGNVSVMPPRPTAPMTTSFVRASSIVFTPLVCQSAMVSTVDMIEPAQLYFEESNCGPGMPTACMIGSAFWIMPI
jgi:hypothetical protein